MSDEIEGVASVGFKQEPVQHVDLIDTESANASKITTLSEAVDDGLSRALQLPGEQASTVTAREDLQSGSAGDVGAEKNDFLSDVAAEGVSTADDAESDALEPLQDRLVSLYTEMTNWQVAWSIAQRTQQDTSHLLKGN